VVFNCHARKKGGLGGERSNPISLTSRGGEKAWQDKRKGKKKGGEKGRDAKHKRLQEVQGIAGKGEVRVSLEEAFGESGCLWGDEGMQNGEKEINLRGRERKIKESNTSGGKD